MIEKFPFTLEDIIKIDSNGGNIGRFYWENQATYMVELIDTDESFEITIGELPGRSAFIWTDLDWVFWLTGGFSRMQTAWDEYYAHQLIPQQ